MSDTKRASDAFRADLHASIVALRAWAQSIADVAAVDEYEEAGYWRLCVAPHEANAARIELIVHATQSIDLSIGPETYEQEPVSELSNLVAIAHAVSAGEVVTRYWRSATTGLPIRTDTLVQVRPGATWRRIRSDIAFEEEELSEAGVAYDKHWLPYRR